MASSKGYLDFILEQLSELEDVSHRARLMRTPKNISWCPSDKSKLGEMMD